MAAPDAEFLRTALPAVTAPDAKFSMALIDFDKGFQWLIQPPKAERRAGGHNTARTGCAYTKA